MTNADATRTHVKQKENNQQNKIRRRKMEITSYTIGSIGRRRKEKEGLRLSYDYSILIHKTISPWNIEPL